MNKGAVHLCLAARMNPTPSVKTAAAKNIAPTRARLIKPPDNYGRNANPQRAGFVRYGIDFVIIEKNEGITPYSKAIGVHARTLEIFDQIGLAQEAVARGTVAVAARLIIDGEIRGELRFSDIGKGMSPFPFVLMLEQSKTEQLLNQYLQSHQKDVLWNTELESFSQDAGGVVAQVRTSDGETGTISAKYIVGCDGPMWVRS